MGMKWDNFYILNQRSLYLHTHTSKQTGPSNSTQTLTKYIADYCEYTYNDYLINLFILNANTNDGTVRRISCAMIILPLMPQLSYIMVHSHLLILGMSEIYIYIQSSN